MKSIFQTEVFRIFFGAVLILFAFSGNALAEKLLGFPTYTKLDQLYIERWTVDEGLISNNLTSVYQSSDGYLWFTSFNGLNRFDGAEFDLYHKENTPALLTNAFYELYENDSGNLLAATQGSYILKMIDGEFRSISNLGKLPKSIRVLIEDKNGAIWAGTNNNGLFYQSDSIFKRFDHKALNEISVYDLLCDDLGNLWVATFGNGLIKIESNGEVTQYTTDDGLVSNLVSSLFKKSNGHILIGTTKGLCILKDTEIDFIRSTEGQNINQIVTDDYQNIWLATESGLTRIHLEKGIYERMTEVNGLPSRQISGLTFDHESTLWLSTKKSGVVRLKMGNVESISIADGLKSRNINIVEEFNGKMYIGSDEGHIQVWDNGVISDFSYNTDINEAGIRDIHLSPDGTFWIASYSGLLMKKNGVERLFDEQQGLEAQDIRRIFPDGEFLWLATRSGGVLRFNKSTFETTVYNTSNYLPSDYILAIEQDQKGNIYFGTLGGGLVVKSKDNSWQTYEASKDSSGFIIFNIHFDRSGNCWLATNIGIYLFEGTEFFKVDFADNQDLETVFDIVEDNQRNFWLTTNLGIAQVDHSDLESFTKAKSGQLRIVKIYDDSDGMLNRECTGATRATLSKKGNIWVPTLGGVVLIRPDQIRFNEELPQIKVKSLIVDGEQYNVQSRINIPPGKNRFEIHFASLSYYAPQKNKFRYKLEGFDKEWIEEHKKREAIYTNLAPGHYTFKVIGSNNDGYWNNDISTMEFYVEPYFYETSWFYVLISIAIVFLLYILYKIRVRRIARRNMELQKLNQELDRFVYSASHDLRAPLASVQGLVKIAQQETSAEQKDEYLQMIRSSIQKLDGFTKEITDFSRNARAEVEREPVDFEALISEIVNDLQYLDKSERIRIDLKIKPYDNFISDNRRLSMIFHNLISNAINYHNTSKEDPYILITVQVENEKAKIEVKDNGRGIARSHLPKIFNMFYRASEGSQGSGLGLYIVKETIEKLKGQVSVNSEENIGTTFTITIPSLRMRREKPPLISKNF